MLRDTGAISSIEAALMTALQITGIAVIAISMLMAARFLNTRDKIVPVLLYFTLTAMIGLALVISDRVTELTLKGVGTLKAATAQAVADADTISQLKGRVENQTATIDLVAQQAKHVEEQNRIAAKKLEELDSAIKSAGGTLDTLRSLADFTSVVSAAQNDDRKAFDRLQQMSTDKNNPFSTRAVQAWKTIFDAHGQGFFAVGFPSPWQEGFDASKLSIDALSQQYQAAATWIKPAILGFISNRNDLSMKARLDFFILVMKTDSSLTAVEYAGRYFTQATGQHIRPLAVEYLVQWWDQHSGEFKDQ
jgi:hypothetical protein